MSIEQVQSVYSKGFGEENHIDLTVRFLQQAGGSLLPVEKAISDTGVGLLLKDSVDCVSTVATGAPMDHFPRYPTTSSGVDAADEVLQQAKASRAECKPYSFRLDLYAEAASLGSVEALYYWAMMLKYGSESADNSCGFEGDAEMEREFDQEVAVIALLICADMGYAPALVPLSFVLLSGIGIDVILDFDKPLWTSSTMIPVPPQYISTSSSSSLMEGEGSAREVYYRISKLHHHLGMFLTNIIIANGTSDHRPCVVWTARDSVVDSLRICSDKESTSSSPRQQETVSHLAVGLLHVAALHGIPEAFTALSYRYQHGIRVEVDMETSAQYALLAADIAKVEFHRQGAQPVHENDRIDDKTVREIPKGKSGNDDEMIQHQIVMAKEGHLPSILAMGGLLLLLLYYIPLPILITGYSILPKYFSNNTTYY